MWSRLALCVGLLVGVGCTASTDSPYLMPEQLSDALLTITDVKGNWQETQRQYFSERSNENPSIDPSLWCSKAEGVADRLSTLAGESGADGVEWTDGDQVTVINDIIEDREIGDESISWVTRVVPPPVTQQDKFESVGRTTVARLGAIVMVLQIGDANWTGTTETMDEDQWWSIVEAAAQKLEEL